MCSCITDCRHGGHACRLIANRHCHETLQQTCYINCCIVWTCYAHLFSAEKTGQIWYVIGKNSSSGAQRRRQQVTHSVFPTNDLQTASCIGGRCLSEHRLKQHQLSDSPHESPPPRLKQALYDPPFQSHPSRTAEPKQFLININPHHQTPSPFSPTAHTGILTPPRLVLLTDPPLSLTAHLDT